jgi:hypothetical protein
MAFVIDVGTDAYKRIETGNIKQMPEMVPGREPHAKNPELIGSISLHRSVEGWI